MSLIRYAPAELPEDIIREDAQDEPVLSGAPGLIYTARIRSLLPVFIAQLFSMFSWGHVERGAITRITELRRALSALFKAERQNYVKVLTHAVETNPELQTQIREDLGGEAALRRWEIRRDKMQAKMQADIEAAPRAPRSQGAKLRASKDARGPITDRTGLFKLASICMDTEARPRSSLRSQSSGAKIDSFRAPPPIGLTPDHLRPRAGEPMEAKIIAATPSVAELEDIWNALQEEHYLWDHLLMIATFMTLSRAFREAYAPP
jgi:hypothetical protein